MYDIINDLTPTQAVRKSAQVGFTTSAILKSFWLASMRNLNCIYTLPTMDDVSKFGKGKVNEIVSYNLFLKSLIPDIDSIGQKKVGDRFIYYQASFTEKEAIIVSSDANFYDEVDRSNLSVIEAYHSRLQASKYKYEYFFSNPSYPNIGVDKYWQKSDQKHWFIKCKKCNEWQYLDWQENIDYEREIFICKKCHNELSDEDRRVGQWVKKWSDKDVSGYWISQMMIPWQSAKELIYLEKNKDKQYFYNFILGQPYIGSDILVNKDLILRNISTENYDTDKVFIGIDVGVEKHFVIGNKDGIFQVSKTPDWDDIENLIIKYNATFVIDGMPDITEPRRLINKFRGKGFIVFYKEDLKTSDLATFEKEKKYGVITADRTRLIETMIDKHIKSQIKYFIDPNELQEYVSHWESLYRVEEEDRFQNKKIRWEHSGADHFVHACLYYEIAKLRGGEAIVIQEEKNLLVGEKSFVVSKEGTIPAISIKEFISKPENDWRYK